MPFWKHKKVIDHPIFGELEFSRFRWRGEVAFPEKSIVSITLPGSEDGPPSYCGDTFAKLRFVFTTLKEDVDSQLFRLFKEYAVQYDISPELEFPVIAHSSDIWKILSLIMLDILGENVIELIFCFRDSNDDGLFSIRIDNGSVSGTFIGD